jgi:hypothetical protein
MRRLTWWWYTSSPFVGRKRYDEATTRIKELSGQVLSLRAAVRDHEVMNDQNLIRTCDECGRPIPSDTSFGNLCATHRGTFLVSNGSTPLLAPVRS